MVHDNKIGWETLQNTLNDLMGSREGGVGAGIPQMEITLKKQMIREMREALMLL